MKKIVVLSLIFMLIVCMMGRVYAAFSCEVNMEASKTQVSKNDEFTVDVKIANIQSEIGFISFGGTLEYDKDSLTLVKMEGQNGWETPSHGSAFNEENGKIAIDRSGVGKNNETIFRMTFQVKEANKSNLVVSLKDMVIADGTVPFKINSISQNIMLVAESSKPIPDAGTDNKKPNNSTNQDSSTSNKNHNTGTSSNSNLGKNTTTNTMSKNINTVKNIDGNTTVKKGVLPKAGTTNGMIIIGISLMTLAAGIFFLKMKRNKAS